MRTTGSLEELDHRKVGCVGISYNTSVRDDLAHSDSPSAPHSHDGPSYKALSDAYNLIQVEIDCQSVRRG